MRRGGGEGPPRAGEGRGATRGEPVEGVWGELGGGGGRGEPLIRDFGRGETGGVERRDPVGVRREGGRGEERGRSGRLGQELLLAGLEERGGGREGGAGGASG